ncbi:MAG: hypothetical protein E2O65_06620 [Gammaproteobacteria bacterium]|nr:MAG: hypothetical protein E2O65_06620 [Gammaproteobacteria bacterium]
MPSLTGPFVPLDGIAVGPRQGQKAFTLQTVLARAEGECDADRRGISGRLFAHCGFAASAQHRARVEQLCRYSARPAVATERLSLTGTSGHSNDNPRIRRKPAGGRFPPLAVQYDRSWSSAGGSAVHDSLRSLKHECFNLCFGELPGLKE